MAQPNSVQQSCTWPVVVPSSMGRWAGAPRTAPALFLFAIPLNDWPQGKKATLPQGALATTCGSDRAREIKASPEPAQVGFTHSPGRGEPASRRNCEVLTGPAGQQHGVTLMAIPVFTQIKSGWPDPRRHHPGLAPAFSIVAARCQELPPRSFILTHRPVDCPHHRGLTGQVPTP